VMYNDKISYAIVFRVPLLVALCGGTELECFMNRMFIGPSIQLHVF